MALFQYPEGEKVWPVSSYFKNRKWRNRIVGHSIAGIYVTIKRNKKFLYEYETALVPWSEIPCLTIERKFAYIQSAAGIIGVVLFGLVTILGIMAVIGGREFDGLVDGFLSLFTLAICILFALNSGVYVLGVRRVVMCFEWGGEKYRMQSGPMDDIAKEAVNEVLKNVTKNQVAYQSNF